MNEKTNRAPPLIDLHSREFIANPYPAYQQLREAEHPFWLPHEDRTGTEGIWLFTRYRDVAPILRDTRTISKDVSRLVPADGLTAFDRMLLNMDPPEHTRLRAMIAPHFSVRRIAGLESRIEGIVDSLIVEMTEHGESEFVADFAMRLPILVIAGVLGVPPEDMPLLKTWTDDMIAGLDSARATDEARLKVAASMSAMTDYLAGLIEKPDHAEGTIIGDLARMQRERGEPNSEEFLGLCVLMVLAGHETTVNLLGNGMLTLLANPGQLALLREDPRLIPSAIDEMLRYESPLQRATYRITIAPYTIGHFTVDEGQQISAVIGAANRDPDQFPSPEVFDVRRDPNRHLAFGAGVHKCLGERLARAEAKFAFGRMLEAFPVMELLDDQPDWQDKTLFRGLKKLRVRLSS